MVKLNRKGFMMAEVIIVSTVMIATMVGLYTGFNKIYASYNERSTFFSVDGIYALKNIEDFLIDEQIMNQVVTTLETNNEIDLTDCNNTTYYNNGYTETLCHNIQEQYHINKLVITKYNSNSITSIMQTKKNDPTYNETFHDYLEYTINNEDFTPDFNYIMLIELKIPGITEDEDNIVYNYANLRMK